MQTFYSINDLYSIIVQCVVKYTIVVVVVHLIHQSFSQLSHLQKLRVLSNTAMKYKMHFGDISITHVLCYIETEI